MTDQLNFMFPARKKSACVRVTKGAALSRLPMPPPVYGTPEWEKRMQKKILHKVCCGSRLNSCYSVGVEEAMAALQPGDEFVVWKFDRYGRTMLESILLALDLERRGINFRSLTESFDTKTPIGKGVMAFVAAIAEDERASLIKRTRAGMAAAKRRGVKLGRPRKLNAKQIEQARMWIASREETASRAAARLGVDVSTLRRALNYQAG